MDIPVLDENSTIMTQGSESKGRRKRTEESQAPATQDEPQAREVEIFEEPEVNEVQRGASQEMPHPTIQASSQPTKRRRKEGPLNSQIKCRMHSLSSWTKTCPLPAISDEEDKGGVSISALYHAYVAVYFADMYSSIGVLHMSSEEISRNSTL